MSTRTATISGRSALSASFCPMRGSSMCAGHPIACCWANFTVSFAHAPPLSYKLSDIGRFYHDYVRLMAHYDRVMPGKIHRLIYEILVRQIWRAASALWMLIFWSFLRGGLPRILQERPSLQFLQQRTGAPADLQGWRGALAGVRTMARPTQSRLGSVLDAYPAVPEFPIEREVWNHGDAESGLGNSSSPGLSRRPMNTFFSGTFCVHGWPGQRPGQDEFVVPSALCFLRLRDLT